MSNELTAITGKIEKAQKELIACDCRHSEIVLLLDAVDTVNGIESEYNKHGFLTLKDAVKVLAEADEIPEGREITLEQIRIDLLKIKAERHADRTFASKKLDRLKVRAFDQIRQWLEYEIKRPPRGNVDRNTLEMVLERITNS